MAFGSKQSEKKVNYDEWQEKCDALYIWHRDPVYRIALQALSGDELRALEVTKKAFDFAFAHLDELGDLHSDKTKAFMVAAVENALTEIYKKVRAQMGIPGEFKYVNTTEKERLNVNRVLIGNELVTNLAQYVDRLTYKERELIFYRFFIGWSIEQIGRHVDLPEEDVNNWIFQVKQKIASMMLEEKR